jgi:RHS repeat-associated protein
MVNGGTTTNYTYNAADQLVSWNEGAKTCAYAYDREGNVIGKTLTDNGTTTDGWDFQYDAANRMDNAVQNAGGTQSLYNTYAGDGWQRVQSVNNGNTMRFGWNGDALLAEFDANGNLTAAYLNDGLDAPLYKTSFSNNGATITGQEFYHQDANGRVHHLTDGQGNIAEKYLYDAFGNQTILDPNNNVLNASAVGNRIGFQGREHDGLAGGSQLGGLQFFRTRFYEPMAGRFLNRNPWGMIHKTPNLYDFVSNNPLRFREPFSEEDDGWNKRPQLDPNDPEPNLAKSHKTATPEGGGGKYQDYRDQNQELYRIPESLALEHGEWLERERTRDELNKAEAEFNKAQQDLGAAIWEGMGGWQGVGEMIFDPTDPTEYVAFIPGIGQAYKIVKCFYKMAKVAHKGWKAAKGAGLIKRVEKAQSNVRRFRDRVANIRKARCLENQCRREAEELAKKSLNEAKDPTLKNVVKDIYKGRSRTPEGKQIGSGSTADAIREEIRTGKPTHGKFHRQEGIEQINAIQRILRRKDVCQSDKDLATQLLKDLQSAIQQK